MKKRNKQYLREKEYRHVLRALDENNTAQRNLGWVELDEPVHVGFTKRLTLRADIANRADASVFQYIIDRFGSTCFYRKAKHIDDPHFDRYPKISEIGDDTYNSLDPKVRKWFSRSIFKYPWRPINYICYVPSFFFEYVVEKKYVTKARIFDEILQQEEAEIKAVLDSKFYKEQYSRYCRAPKAYRKTLNRRERTKANRVLFDIMNNVDGYDDYVFQDCYKGAAWSYW